MTNVFNPLTRSTVDLDLLAKSYTYNGDGTLATESATDGGANTWVKTYGYTSGKMTSESVWVKQ